MRGRPASTIDDVQQLPPPPLQLPVLHLLLSRVSCLADGPRSPRRRHRTRRMPPPRRPPGVESRWWQRWWWWRGNGFLKRPCLDDVDCSRRCARRPHRIITQNLFHNHEGLTIRSDRDELRLSRLGWAGCERLAVAADSTPAGRPPSAEREGARRVGDVKDSHRTCTAISVGHAD